MYIFSYINGRKSNVSETKQTKNAEKQKCFTYDIFFKQAIQSDNIVFLFFLKYKKFKFVSAF